MPVITAGGVVALAIGVARAHFGAAPFGDLANRVVITTTAAVGVGVLWTPGVAVAVIAAGSGAALAVGVTETGFATVTSGGFAHGVVVTVASAIWV